MTSPDAIKNKYKFPTPVVNTAAGLMQRWFQDAELGPCRVVGFGGKPNKRGDMEPVLYYTHVGSNGDIVQDSSTVPEVARWVAADTTNL
jgi:hypothetical protein